MEEDSRQAGYCKQQPVDDFSTPAGFESYGGTQGIEEYQRSVEAQFLRIFDQGWGDGKQECGD